MKQNNGENRRYFLLQCNPHIYPTESISFEIRPILDVKTPQKNRGVLFLFLQLFIAVKSP